jgi:hypothetical protein
MLLLLRGGSWLAIREHFTAGELIPLAPANRAPSDSWRLLIMLGSLIPGGR